MKIAIDARFWGPVHTGLGRYTESLVSNLHQIGCQHHIDLLVNPNDKGKISKSLPDFNTVTCSAKPYSFLEQWQILRVLHRLKPDLVHFPHFNVPVLYNRPFIVTIHDLIKHRSTGLATTTKSPLGYWLKRVGYYLAFKKAISQSEEILTPSNWVKKDILDHYSVPADKVIVTPEAPTSVYSRPEPAKISSSLKHLQPYLIYVGNAYPHKNLIQLIKVVKILNQKHDKNQFKQLKLVIITAKNVFYKRLNRQISRLKADSFVHLKGFITDQELKTWYQHSLAFIIPSFLEGFGLPGLEAMASGTVVLSSNQACLPEVYQQGAVYFDPDSVNDMVEKINSVYQLTLIKRKSLIEKGRKQAQKFSWGKTAQDTLSAYQKVLDNLKR